MGAGADRGSRPMRSVGTCKTFAVAPVWRRQRTGTQRLAPATTACRSWTARLGTSENAPGLPETGCQTASAGWGEEPFRSPWFFGVRNAPRAVATVSNPSAFFGHRTRGRVRHRMHLAKSRFLRRS